MILLFFASFRTEFFATVSCAKKNLLTIHLIHYIRFEDFSSKPSEDIVIGWITEKGYHMGNVMNAFRLAVVGECKGPHMFDITALLGKEETLARIQRAIETLK